MDVFLSTFGCFLLFSSFFELIARRNWLESKTNWLLLSSISCSTAENNRGGGSGNYPLGRFASKNGPTRNNLRKSRLSLFLSSSKMFLVQSYVERYQTTTSVSSDGCNAIR